MLSGIPFKGTSLLSPSDPPRYQPGDTAVEPEEPEEPALQELNASLDLLTTIFPDVQAEVFREMLTSFSEESRLEVVTEAMLRHPDKWVRGRRRTSATADQDEPSQTDADRMALSPEDKFRNNSYKLAVKEAMYQEFKGLSHSTIKAVLAEYNYSYTRARPTLLSLASKSWRLSITSFFTRRKPPSSTDHPLVVWRKPDPKTGRPAVPGLVPTKSTELNRELHETLVAPVLAKQKSEQLAQDRALAEELNDEEAEAAGEMYDCECCFTPSAFENMSACDTNGHWICFRCIRYSISEALFGQGWARSINPDRLTLVCIAPVADGVSNCQGCLPRFSIERAFADDKDGAATLRKLEERAATEALLKSQLPLIRCPFCAYAEVDDAQLSSHSWKLKAGPLLLLRLLLLSALLSPFLRHVLFLAAAPVLAVLASAYLFPSLVPHLPLSARLLASRTRVARKRRGLKFLCASPLCQRASCLACQKAWRDPHACHESALQSLRAHVENAVSEAAKRTCPQCNLSFVKGSGCNKLTCPCGYAMCYVCRQRIGPGDGYAHFCQHFREAGRGRCAECEKCDLWKEGDEDAVLREVALSAEEQWRGSKEGKGNDGSAGLGGSGLGGLGLGGKGGKAWGLGMGMGMRMGMGKARAGEMVFVGGRGDEGDAMVGEWLDWALEGLLA
ncbi:uncharacterized protein K452DRAFT_349516 [Aplosporella prunicola CBS 121167]|uniref:RING-type domain-containing protein n=1 Tax=Aplosporella prunicola CBS 121167 TaxID=1176127 RepID=A0A6A6BMD1_9PEZI|nr:uncharacterized protein K452DRAFT_349516 [Aplosporella prunicola CBS 121167]KAF2145282.1 hypothetical protein K452DRAFT_349516 [Aplosporella prunicola CBS 121167]